MASVSANANVYHFISKVEDAEIRRIEDDVNSFTIKDTGEVKAFHSIKLTCDVGEDMDRVIFKDKNMENLSKYKRGMIGTFLLRIDVVEDFGSKARFTVFDFIVDGKSILDLPPEDSKSAPVDKKSKAPADQKG